MAVKTIEDLTAHVAFDKANDIIHLWQPAASGEKDRKSTLDDVIGLLNTNTTFSNIPYLDKENSFAENMNLAKKLNIGGHPSPVETLEIYSAAADINARIQTAKVNGIAGLILENDVQSWQPRVDAADNFVVRDVTNSLNPITVVPSAPTNSLYIAASGDVGFGRTPTLNFDFYRSIADIIVSIETDKANGAAQLYLTNDAQTWAVQTRGVDNFGISDISGGSIVPFQIEPTTPTNSLYMDSTGAIGLGAAPTATMDYRLQLIRGDSGANFVSFLNSTTGVNPATSGFYIGISGSENAFIWNRENTYIAFGTNNTDRMYITAGGSLLWRTATELYAALGTIESFGAWALIGRSSNNDNTAKTTKIGLTHYTNAEEPIFLIYGFCDIDENRLHLGGGANDGNAVTDIRFFTAANNTTVAGTERGRFISSGELLIGQTDLDGTGALLQVAGDMSLRGASDTDRMFFFASDGYILWNDDDEFFDNGNRPFVQGALIVQGASLTEDNIFDALDTHIPNNGNVLKITGHFITGGATYEVVYAERQSSSTIELYGISAGVLASAVMTDGDGTGVTEVRLVA